MGFSGVLPLACPKLSTTRALEWLLDLGAIGRMTSASFRNVLYCGQASGSSVAYRQVSGSVGGHMPHPGMSVERKEKTSCREGKAPMAKYSNMSLRATGITYGPC